MKECVLSIVMHFFLFKKDVSAGKGAWPAKRKWFCENFYGYSDPQWNSMENFNESLCKNFHLK